MKNTHTAHTRVAEHFSTLYEHLESQYARLAARLESPDSTVWARKAALTEMVRIQRSMSALIALTGAVEDCLCGESSHAVSERLLADAYTLE